VRVKTTVRGWDRRAPAPAVPAHEVAVVRQTTAAQMRSTGLRVGSAAAKFQSCESTQGMAVGLVRPSRQGGSAAWMCVHACQQWRGPDSNEIDYRHCSQVYSAIGAARFRVGKPRRGEVFNFELFEQRARAKFRKYPKS
jgi:hypothetical protein